jgi:hypothetical protein
LIWGEGCKGMAMGMMDMMMDQQSSMKMPMTQ